MKSRKMSIEKLLAMKRRQEKIVMVTTYDCPSAQMAEEAEVDIAFVGDSLGMLVLGHQSTVPVTLDEMLIFAKAVARGARNPLLLVDLPFGAYTNTTEGIQSSTRMVKEGGMEAVKLEGGANVAPIVEAIVNTGIPVMGHLGLTPQTSAAHGGFKLQAKRAHEARRLIEDALALQAAGAFGVVLETIPMEVAAAITNRLTIPTIGIGSGICCDGQVLVWHDMLGISEGYGRHVKAYAHLHQTIVDALQTYSNEVRSSDFPEEEQTWHMASEELGAFVGMG